LKLETSTLDKVFIAFCPAILDSSSAAISINFLSAIAAPTPWLIN